MEGSKFTREAGKINLVQGLVPMYRVTPCGYKAQRSLFDVGVISWPSAT